MKLYKFTKAGGESLFGAHTWDLPKWSSKKDKWKPGKWYAVFGDLEPCSNGVHVCDASMLYHWYEKSRELYEVELEKKAKVLVCATKLVTRRARLIKKIDIQYEDMVEAMAMADEKMEELRDAPMPMSVWQKTWESICGQALEHIFHNKDYKNRI